MNPCCSQTHDLIINVMHFPQAEMGNHLATMRVPDGGIVIKNMDKEDGAKSELPIRGSEKSLAVQ